MTPVKRLLLLTNGPGEITNWVAPVVARITQHFPQYTIDVALVPCQYASGGETRLLASLPIDRVTTPSQTLRHIITGWPDASTIHRVIGLGGDPMYVRLLAKRMGCQGWWYTDRPATHPNAISRLQIGDLMASRMALDAPPIPSIPRYTLGWMPGSRPIHLRAFGPFSVQTIQLLLQRHPDWQVVVARSGSIGDEDWNRSMAGLPESVSVVGHSLDAMVDTRMMVSLPGTGTAELGYLHIPLLMVLPLNDVSRLKFDGGIGLLGELPIVGRWLKQGIVSWLKRRKPMLALPNLRAGERVVPEFVDVMTPHQLADRIEFELDPVRLQTTQHHLQAMLPSLEPVDRLIHRVMGE